MSRPRRPQLSLQLPETLQVLDMGLDFRSYLSRVDENDVPILGNVISYAASKVPDIFDPTVGLLVAILHLFAQCTTVKSSITWLKTYDTIQKVYLEQQEGNTESEGVKYAKAARQVIESNLSLGESINNQSVMERLLSLLDYQSGIRGPQAPSQRKIQRDPKGAFCNLHLADHKCFQEFACNQLHLHEAGPVRHRTLFFQRLGEVLLEEHRPPSEVIWRIEDSIFFARYGNKTTVNYGSGTIPFFKTLYTAGRLKHAFRRQTHACRNPTCTDEECEGIHPQDRRVPAFSKPIHLTNVPQIEKELKQEAERIFCTLLNEERGAEPSPSLSLSTPTTALSPTAELWKSTVRDYVRLTCIPQVEADESLLRTLQDTKVTGTPLSTSERMTPLLDELDTYAFSSSLSSVNSEPHH